MASFLCPLKTWSSSFRLRMSKSLQRWSREAVSSQLPLRFSFTSITVFLWACLQAERTNRLFVLRLVSQTQIKTCHLPVTDIQVSNRAVQAAKAEHWGFLCKGSVLWSWSFVLQSNCQHSLRHIQVLYRFLLQQRKVFISRWNISFVFPYLSQYENCVARLSVKKNKVNLNNKC